MNKEVKEIIQKIEDVRDNPAILDDDGWCDNWMVMSAKECNILLDYINQLEEEIKKLKNMYNYHYKYASDMEGKYVMAKGVTDWLKIWLEEMLDKPNDIFSVVRIKDVLDKIKELEGDFNE